MAEVIPSPFSEEHFISHQIDNGPDKMQGFPSLLTKKIFYIGIIHQKLKRGTGMEVQDGRIQNEEELHKKLYRLRKLKEEQERADAQRERELVDTAAWYQPETDRRSTEIADVEALISDFYMRQYEENPYYKFKSRNGTVSKRTSNHYDHNDKQLVDLVDDKFVKTTKKLDWAKYKATLTVLDDGRCVDENGELVPVTVQQQVKVMIKTTGEK